MLTKLVLPREIKDFIEINSDFYIDLKVETAAYVTGNYIAILRVARGKGFEDDTGHGFFYINDCKNLLPKFFAKTIKESISLALKDGTREIYLIDVSTPQKFLSSLETLGKLMTNIK